MLIRFTGQRLLQTAIVAVAIIFFVHLGMLTVNNTVMVNSSMRVQRGNILAAD